MVLALVLALTTGASAVGAQQVGVGNSQEQVMDGSGNRNGEKLGLRQLFEFAWSKAPQGRWLQARGAEALTNVNAARSLFPGAPALSVAARSDRWQGGTGKEEREIGLAVPLWLPGQQQARQGLADGESREHQASIAVARLNLAGELRSRLWAWQMARVEQTLAQERLESTLLLEEDVAKRVRAGDLAHSDLLLARQESQNARLAIGEAIFNTNRAAAAYEMLTGGRTLPGDAEESLAGLDPKAIEELNQNSAGQCAIDSGEQEGARSKESPPRHPRLLENHASMSRARLNLEFARRSRSEAPTAAVLLRQEKDALGAAFQSSVGFSINLPLPAEVRHAPMLANALTALAQAESQCLQLVRELYLEQQEAQLRLHTSQEAEKLAAETTSFSQQRMDLITRSYELGETALVEFIRARAQYGEARLTRARSHVQAAAARAALLQAFGMLP